MLIVWKDRALGRIVCGSVDLFGELASRRRTFEVIHGFGAAVYKAVELFQRIDLKAPKKNRSVRQQLPFNQFPMFQKPCRKIYAFPHRANRKRETPTRNRKLFYAVKLRRHTDSLPP